MKTLSIIFALLACSSVLHAQNDTIQRMEHELRVYGSLNDDEARAKMTVARQLLSIDSLNYKAIAYIADTYVKANQRDSIDVFFDDLARKHPRNALPYLYRAQLGRYGTAAHMGYLKKGYDMDPNKDATVRFMQNELIRYRNFNEDELHAKFILAKVLLSLDSLNYRAIAYITDTYGKAERRDSIDIFFDDLARKHPRSALPYLYRAQLGGYETDARIGYLKKGYDIDPKNDTLIYTLGKLYYDLFIDTYRSADKAASSGYADSCIFYLEKIAPTDKYRSYVYAPLLQLYYFTGNEARKREAENNPPREYFPVLTFTGMPADWRTNYYAHLFKAVEYSMIHLKWYARDYGVLQEPSIANGDVQGDVVRFLWLRSFANPVVIKVTRHNGSTSVNWKRADGRGGYDPGKLIVDETKTLSDKEWKDLSKLLSDEKFWEMKTIDNKFSGFDGTQCVIEVSIDKKYHIVDRWGGYDIGPICLYLFGLTDIDPGQEHVDGIRSSLEKIYASHPQKDSMVVNAMKTELTVDPDDGYDLMIPKKYKEALEAKARRDQMFEHLLSGQAKRDMDAQQAKRDSIARISAAASPR